MSMNGDDLKLWNTMISAPNEYVSAEELAKNTNFSRRQVIAHMDALYGTYIDKQRDGRNVYYILHGTSKEIERYTMEILAKKLACKPSDVEAIVSHTSIAGYITLDAIMENTNMSPYDVALILRIMPNIESSKMGTKKQHYIRVI